MKKRMLLILPLAMSLAANAQHYKSVATGTQFNVALRSDSTLWAWGYNQNGQVGNGTTTTVTAPVQVDSANKWIAVAAGGFHRLAIAADSTLWGTGLNGNGQLGLPASQNPTTASVKVDNHQWRSVSCGMVNSAAIRNDGTLWTSGLNYYGELGIGDTTTQTGFVQVGTDNDWKAVSVGGVHMLALKNDGSLWAWGFNANGQLGTGSTVDEHSPTRVGTANDWVSISAGFEFSMAMKTNGTIWNWGFNGNGQLGRNASLAMDSVVNQLGTDTDWKFINAGASFAFGIKQNGTLWGWGYNGVGQLGFSPAQKVATPNMLTADSNWTYISGATGSIYGNLVIGTHSAGLKGDATGICTTGDNQAAQLGNGTIGGSQDEFICTVGDLTTAVKEVVQTQENISVYPNPVYDYAQIKIAGNKLGQTLELKLTDMTGKVCLQETIVVTGKNGINMQHLPTGVYFLHLTDQKGMVYTSKLVKE